MLKTALNRSTIALLQLSILCVVFISLRMFLRGNPTYIFLIWNLFLAWIPFWLISLVEKVKPMLSKFSIFALTLLFLPNSPYIITDLLHLNHYDQNMIWFDSLLIFTFAFTGLLIGLKTLQKGHEILKHHFGALLAWGLILTSTLLSGFGIYLGRYCRLNSWDVFRQPLWFLARVLHQFENPLAYKMTLIFGLVLFGIYYIFYTFAATNQQK